MKQRVYIVDFIAERGLQLQGILAEEQTVVEYFPLLRDALLRIKEAPCDFLLLHREVVSGVEGLEKLFSLSNCVVYGESGEVSERLLWYRQGAYRVLLTPVELLQRTAQVVRKHQFRRQALQKRQREQLTLGSIRPLSMREVFLNALLEQKSLILKVQQKTWKAKLRIQQGHVLEARGAGQHGTEVALKILQLPAGSFVLRRQKVMEPAQVDFPSTLALVAEADFQRQMVQQFARKVGMSNPRFSLGRLPENASLTPEEQLLWEAVNKYASLRDLILHAPLPIPGILRLLEQFLEKKWISLEGEASEEEYLQEQDVEFIRQELLPEGVRQGKIVVLGLPSSGKSELIKTLCGRYKTEEKTLQSVDFARLPLKPGLSLYLVGIAIDENFMALLEKLASDMVACIVLIDLQARDKLEYTKYFLQTFLQRYTVPMVVGVTNFERPPGLEEIRDLRKALDIPPEIEVIPVRPDSFGQIRQLLYNLNRVESIASGSSE